MMKHDMYIYIICQVSSRGRRLADPFHCSECCIEIANRQGGSRAEYEKINWLVAKFCSLASKTLFFSNTGSIAKQAVFFKGPNITLWLFNIAMENGPFIDGLPIKNGDFPCLC